MAKDTNVGEGDASTGGLPKRINKAARHKAQERAARVERGSFSIPDRPGRPKGHDGYNHNRDA